MSPGVEALVARARVALRELKEISEKIRADMELATDISDYAKAAELAEAVAAIAREMSGEPWRT